RNIRLLYRHADARRDSRAHYCRRLRHDDGLDVSSAECVGDKLYERLLSALFQASGIPEIPYLRGSDGNSGVWGPHGGGGDTGGLRGIAGFEAHHYTAGATKLWLRVRLVAGGILAGHVDKAPRTR